MDNTANQGAAAPNPLQDGKDIARQAVIGVQAVCDAALDQTGNELPKLEGDVLDLANSMITARLGNNPFASILQTVLATGEKAALGQIDAKAKAFIVLLKTDADSAFGHIETKLT
jgi:hypothetical protein